MPKVLVGLPTYDNKVDARLSLYLYAARRDNLIVDVKSRQLSLLAWCFNMLWCEALNNKTYDYFLLLHADTVPIAPQGWLSKLIAEAENAHADLFAVVSPLKNKTGLTSTAAQSLQHAPRRLTMREAVKLPQTFKAWDVAKVYGWETETQVQLLVNTGCLLMDLRRNRSKWETMFFKIRDKMEKVDGKFVSTCTPEDWDFSEQAHANGLTVAATRAISLLHNGSADYENQTAWGELERDV